MGFYCYSLHKSLEDWTVVPSLETDAVFGLFEWTQEIDSVDAERRLGVPRDCNMFYKRLGISGDELGKIKRRRKSKVFLAKMENPNHIVNNRQTHTMTKRRVDETCKRLNRRSKEENTTNQTKSYGRKSTD